MKESYKTTAKQRAKMLQHYYDNRERLLEYQRKYRQEQKERQANEKHFDTPQEFYQDWNEYILKRLNSPKKLPKWIKVGLELQWLRNQQTLNELNNQK